ncbi:MAG TPA: TIGR03435 family protein [Vicinamibacterales bacterium]|nr:TIGR03435 family protein [Vicinamibacterales bacterium]
MNAARTPVVLMLIGTALASLSAQGRGGEAPTFDVASIKPNRTGRGLAIVTLQPSGRVSTDNMAVRDLIVTAYGIDEIQLVGLPAWATSERFSVEARTDGSVSNEQVRLMLRSLLADRFSLIVHNETRTLQALLLVLARKDGALGERLRRSGDECARITPPPGVPMPPPPPPGPPGGIRPILPKDPDVRRGCGAMAIAGWLSARKFAMDRLAQVLSVYTKRPVLDRTGLDGEFDIDLSFTPEFETVGPLTPGGGPPPVNPDGPSLFTAVQEQLGLRLDSQRASVEVLVIDSLERASPN